VGKSVVFDGAPNRRYYRGEFVVGEIDCRHGSAPSPRNRMTVRGESGDDARIVGRLKHPSDDRVLADPVRRQISPATPR
jgi:hypothetical protein